MRFYYIFVEQDYIEFNRFHSTNTGGVFKKFLTSFIVTLIIGSLMFFAFSIATNKGDFSSMQMLPLVALITVVLMWKLNKNRFTDAYSKTIIKATKKNNPNSFDVNITYNFEDDCFIQISEQATSSIKYNAIMSVKKTDFAIYLYVSKVQAHILPYRAFESVQQRVEFFDFITSKSHNNI